MRMGGPLCPPKGLRMGGPLCPPNGQALRPARTKNKKIPRFGVAGGPMDRPFPFRGVVGAHAMRPGMIMRRVGACHVPLT
jgi:hypothetical protein